MNKLYLVSRQQHIQLVSNITPKPIVFYHLPKTGGTTLDCIFEALNYRCGFNQIRVSGPLYTRAWSEGSNKNNCAADKLEDLDLKRPDSKTFISGHFPFEVSNNLPETCHNVTILREPLARSRSHFLFGAKRKFWGMDADVRQLYATKRIIDNPQVRQLSGNKDPLEKCSEFMLTAAIKNIDQKFDFVTVLEKFNSLLKAMITVFNLPDILFPRAMVGKSHRVRFNKKVLPVFEEFNGFDKILYNYVNSKQNPFREEMLHFVPTAINTENKKPILVTHPELKLNGQKFPLVSHSMISDLGTFLQRNGYEIIYTDTQV